MPVTADYHVHSSNSGDSDTPMEKQVLAAINAGIRTLCITEHLDFDFPYENTPDLPEGCFDLDSGAYRREYLELKERYADRIRLLYGVELGLQPHLVPVLEQHVAAHPEYDFIIGSTHVVDRMDPYYPVYFEGRTKEAAIRRYFEIMLENIRAFHDFDTCGHLDYIVRYAPGGEQDFTKDRYLDAVDPVLRTLISFDIALEVNTSALPADGQHTRLNPCEWILRRYRELGGQRITIGSDAHRPDRVAFGFQGLCPFLKSLGFTSYEVFEGRMPTSVPL